MQYPADKIHNILYLIALVKILSIRLFFLFSSFFFLSRDGISNNNLRMTVCLFVCVSVCLFVCVSGWLSVCLCVCVSVYVHGLIKKTVKVPGLILFSV